MSRDQDKLIRQLSLLSFLLSRPRPFSAREIRDSVEGYYGMSDDTFARRFYGDRADLEKIGIEIRALGPAESADIPMYCLPEENYRLPSLQFTPAELHSLALALATLDGRFAYARPLRLALMAISKGQPDPLHDDLEQLPIALAPDEDARRAGRQLARLEQAVTRGKTVCFSYPAEDGSFAERTFDPYSLFLIQGHWYAVGFDHARQAMRTFRVARIEDQVRFLTEKARDFVIPDDYDPEVYGARPPWLIGPVRDTAVVKVEPELSWWVTRLEPHVRSLGEDDQGCHNFELPYADEEILLSWTVGLGGCGQLVAPTELRERLRLRLLDVLAAHEGAPPEPRSSSAPAHAVPGQECAPETPADKVAVSTASGLQRAESPTAPETAPIAPEHLARTLTLLSYLVSEQRTTPIPWEDLAHDLGLTRAEVENDLSLLNLMNFGGGTYALLAEADDQGVHVTRDVMADTFVNPARLSPLMARALLLAIDLLGDAIELETAGSLASVRAKVRALVGDEADGQAVVVDDVMPPSPDIMAVLNEGVRDHQVVEIEYFTPSREELTARRIEPYLLFRSREGWYVEAYCLEAQAQRTFRVELIRSAIPTTESFERRDDVDLSLRRDGMAFSVDAAAHQATIRFAARWRTYLEDRSIEYDTLSDGSLTARVPYLDERWMAREVVRFLGGAVLERPEEIRTIICHSAATLLQQYDDGTSQASERPRQ